jgi:DNA-binding GntR family transcriptional regulator
VSNTRRAGRYADDSWRIRKRGSIEMSRLLNISQTKPILEKVSRGYLVDGQVFEYSRNAFNTDDYKFTLIAQRKSPR